MSEIKNNFNQLTS